MLRAVFTIGALALVSCSGGSSDPAPGSLPPAANPKGLPLLAAGTSLGLVYSAPSPATQVALDTAFAQAIGAGLGAYELTIRWSAIEVAPGVFDTTQLDSLLATVSATGLAPYLLVTTIDTVQLNLPADLLDPLDSTALAAGYTFDDPRILTRFDALLDVVVPRLVANGGFFLAVGNEVDGWLSSRPSAQTAFTTFAANARQHAHTIEPELAVGVSVTFGLLAADPTLFALVRAANDITPFTYYPLNPDFSVRPPTDVAADFSAMLAAVAPDPLLLQEVGYPAGNSPMPSNGSSEELQRQFVEAIFLELTLHPEVRFCSFLHLGDWSPSQLDTFVTYYGLPNPLFREYLGSLGMHDYTSGMPKSAWAELVLGLQSL